MPTFGGRSMKLGFKSRRKPRIIISVNLIQMKICWSHSKQIYAYDNIRFLNLFAFISILSVCSAHVAMGEQCDWTGSGLEMSGGKWTAEIRGITPVYLRCYQGRVSWVYPRGGLRVLLRLGSTGKDFKGCIKVNPSFAGARIFLEDRKFLTELYSPDDRLPVKLARCFRSRSGQAALYIEEAAPSSSPVLFPKYLAEFSYDLEAVRPNSYDAEDKCKPCDKEELMHAFCTNDLVVSGSIDAIRQQEEMDESEISVRVDKFLKYSSFEAESSGKTDTNRRENDINNNTSLTITVPKICQSKPGTGQFVFMARKRFDDFSLVCAPRLEDWKRLVWAQNEKGDSHCILSY